MSFFLISAARAIIEMLGLCLVGQGMLYILAGQRRANNRIYQLFDLLTKAPRRLVAALLPRSSSDIVIGVVSFALLLLLWIGLAFIRKFV
ncbi:hypothetical protein [Ferribacterium limneticum]|uniref:hypothetical protein n=1 Tax=Ferribacterium limneticum TaxID=76259 RepID=UPI001CF97362|nr:hypothetical protein [Ferribacterium limneticum]UCV27077.1 hypothetical protein KI617_12335 [Ferribacterium limneticum]UCV30994.1 hypothetical protein KI608_12335 [Ferribacterium limneticum]